MRRSEREITDFNEMIKILEAAEVCRLGLMDEKTPYIVPLNFGYEVSDGQVILYFHGAGEGKKISLIREHGAASFEIDTDHRLSGADVACDFSYFYSSIIGEGSIELLEDLEDKLHGLKQIMKHYAHADVSGIPMSEEIALRTAVMRLTVSRWTGKRH